MVVITPPFPLLSCGPFSNLDPPAFSSSHPFPFFKRQPQKKGTGRRPVPSRSFSSSSLSFKVGTRPDDGSQGSYNDQMTKVGLVTKMH
jgi:hypothetical protein